MRACVRSASIGIAAFAVARGGDAAVELDRHRAAEIGADIEAELAAAGLVERGLDAHFGVGVAARLAIVEGRGDAVDLDVAVM